MISSGAFAIPRNLPTKLSGPHGVQHLSERPLRPGYGAAPAAHSHEGFVHLTDLDADRFAAAVPQRHLDRVDMVFSHRNLQQ
ncbi:hypothetical protein [Streptomyces atroolivaceus]|uniref:hypothetical protein n=1 Tax=Streptomyces atroolivaceus TaxID=66869 RepID=UPI00363BB890